MSSIKQKYSVDPRDIEIDLGYDNQKIDNDEIQYYQIDP